MPLLNKRRLPYENQTQRNGNSQEENMYYLRCTNETFTSHRVYMERWNLCHRNQWECEVTGRQNLTYQEALDSEGKNGTRVEFHFCRGLRTRIFSYIQFKTADLQTLAEDVHSYFVKNFSVGEMVYCTFSGGIKCRGLIKGILPNPKYMSSGPSSTSGDSSPFNFVVSLIDLDGNPLDNYMRFMKLEKLSRDPLWFNVNHISQLVSECSTRENYRNAPWILKDYISEHYGVNTTLPKSLKQVQDAYYTKKKENATSNADHLENEQQMNSNINNKKTTDVLTTAHSSKSNVIYIDDSNASDIELNSPISTFDDDQVIDLDDNDMSELSITPFNHYQTNHDTIASSSECQHSSTSSTTCVANSIITTTASPSATSILPTSPLTSPSPDSPASSAYATPTYDPDTDLSIDTPPEYSTHPPHESISKSQSPTQPQQESSNNKTKSLSLPECDGPFYTSELTDTQLTILVNTWGFVTDLAVPLKLPCMKLNDLDSALFVTSAATIADVKKMEPLTNCIINMLNVIIEDRKRPGTKTKLVDGYYMRQYLENNDFDPNIMYPMGLKHQLKNSQRRCKADHGWRGMQSCPSTRRWDRAVMGENFRGSWVLTLVGFLNSVASPTLVPGVDAIQRQLFIRKSATATERCQQFALLDTDVKLQLLVFLIKVVSETRVIMNYPTEPCLKEMDNQEASSDDDTTSSLSSYESDDTTASNEPEQQMYTGLQKRLLTTLPKRTKTTKRIYQTFPIHEPRHHQGSVFHIRPLGKDRFFQCYLYLENSDHIMNSGSLLVLSPAHEDTLEFLKQHSDHPSSSLSSIPSNNRFSILELITDQWYDKQPRWLSRYIAKMQRNEIDGNWLYYYSDPHKIHQLLKWLNPELEQEQELLVQLKKHLHGILENMETPDRND